VTVAVWRRLSRAETRLAGDGTTVAGVDEAGRGPLAGPVVAAAVVLAPKGRWDGLNDSKQMTPEAREQMFARVLTEARAFSWAVFGPRAVDRMNIRRASLRAMGRAVARLSVIPDLVLVDGDATIPGVTLPQQAIVSGDARMLSIAAASVVAKVVRDRIMECLDRVYPSYGFARHKGYGTPEHLAALDLHGPCALHRYSYSPVCVLELPFGDAATAEIDATLPERDPASGPLQAPEMEPVQ
jgi:ribonuclease HII